ncbi:MAG: hypothetical protein WA326_11580 [Nitrososphaeraceae archaeon]
MSHNIQLAKDTAEDVNTTFSLKKNFVSVVVCGKTLPIGNRI